MLPSKKYKLAFCPTSSAPRVYLQFSGPVTKSETKNKSCLGIKAAARETLALEMRTV